MGFLPEEPKHFNSLREEFVHGLMKRLEDEKYKNWEKWGKPKNYFDGKKKDYLLIN